MDELAERMGYLQTGGVRDRQRAAQWFVEWWRTAGGTAEEAGLDRGVGVGGSEEWGWGLDCQWADRSEDPLESPTVEEHSTPDAMQIEHRTPTLESKFDHLISQHLKSLQESEGEVSETQMKKREKEERQQRRMEKGKDMAKKRDGAQKRRDKR